MPRPRSSRSRTTGSSATCSRCCRSSRRRCDLSPKPLWIPSQDRIDRANLSRFMRFVRAETGNADLNSYAPLYRFSVDQPAQFWTLLWDFVGIRGSGEREPVVLSDGGIASARWFPNVSLNVAMNL